MPQEHRHTLLCIHMTPCRTQEQCTSTHACSRTCTRRRPLLALKWPFTQQCARKCRTAGSRIQVAAVTALTIGRRCTWSAPAHGSVIFCKNHMINLKRRWAAPTRAAPGQRDSFGQLFSPWGTPFSLTSHTPQSCLNPISCPAHFSSFPVPQGCALWLALGHVSYPGSSLSLLAMAMATRYGG